MNLDSFINKVETQIIDPFITLLALAAFILFVYGVFEFFRGADNEEKRKTGQQHMIWSVIGLTIIFGAKVIITIMQKIVS
jgi:uncharacterized membrane protein YidH (DUF202 family)